MWALTVDTAPTDEPVTRTEAKAHLRVTDTAEDSLIDDMIAAARIAAEAYMRRAITTQTLKLHLPGWPSDPYIELPKPPLSSVTSVKYTDKDGDESTMTATDYVVVTAQDPGRIALKWDKSWPSTSLQVGLPIVIEYVAGYGAESTIDKDIKQAVNILVAQQYENREPVVVGTIIREIPMTAKWLMNDRRVHQYRFGGLP
tara:strand:- start:396 stop:995 length:600 start_codon:yes stop_codon:yes gene_type:complete